VRTSRGAFMSPPESLSASAPDREDPNRDAGA
jgi:hypothetical protein